MSKKKELLESIKSYAATLEKDDLEDYDAVTCSLSIFQDITELIGGLFAQDKIRAWKEQEDPNYDRFTSKLKMALDKQRIYMQSIQDQLVAAAADDTILKKIAEYQKSIDEVREQEKSIFNVIQPLIEKEDELRRNKESLDVLLVRKATLEGIEKQLSDVNLEELAKEVEKKEQLKAELENTYKPLMEKRETLQNDVDGMKDAIREISRKVDQLEGADSELAIRVLKSLPSWIEKIKARKSSREEKSRKYALDLETEVIELQKIEAQIKDNIDKINQYVSAAMTNQEIMRAHFRSDKILGDRFSKSLIDLQDDITSMTGKIENDLNKFDDDLRQMQIRIQDAASQYVQIGI